MGYRGPRKHLKRLAAPNHWMLDKLSGVFAPRPSPGPHKLRECIPLIVLLRNRLKYALTRKECMMITMNRDVQVDGKVRTDMNFPAGFMDVISLPKTGENFRLLYDVKGRFVLHPVSEDEANFKLCRVRRAQKGKKSAVGRNPLGHGQGASIPYVVTHDGRTIRYPDPKVAVNDTVKVDLKTGKIVDFVKFDIGKLAVITKGSNTGRIGVISHRDRHPGAFDMIRLVDKRGHEFSTRLDNVFIIGEEKNPWVSLPKGHGIRLSVVEDKAKRLQRAGK